jgi:uncharacterized phage protein (TIGR01671 family)
MRDIKFRAWYKPDFETKDGALKFQQVIIFDEVKFCYGLDEEQDTDRLLMYSFEIPFLDNDWILQQYTGLKDKNGVEIYEGDLINYTCIVGEGDYQKEINQEVFFEDGMFLFDRDALFCMSDSNFLKQSIEVVGNIFENKELIK